MDVICRILRMGRERKRSMCFSSRLIQVLKVHGVDRTGAGRYNGTQKLLIQHFCLYIVRRAMVDARLERKDLAI